MSMELVLIILFSIKHLFCDFMFQCPRHYLHKGAYGAWGGIEHAIIHGIGTWIILGPIYGIIDALLHYHIDWGKMNINRKFNLKPDNSEYFWYMIGIDQFLHSLTYIGLIWWYIS